MESGKDQLANQLGQAENEVINGKSQAFVAESDLSQNYTVLKATDELIKRATRNSRVFMNREWD